MAFLLRHARRINVFVCAQLRSMGICSDSMTIKTSYRGFVKICSCREAFFADFLRGAREMQDCAGKTMGYFFRESKDKRYGKFSK